MYKISLTINKHGRAVHFNEIMFTLHDRFLLSDGMIRHSRKSVERRMQRTALRILRMFMM